MERNRKVFEGLQDLGEKHVGFKRKGADLPTGPSCLTPPDRPSIVAPLQSYLHPLRPCKCRKITKEKAQG
jgi:hypothetical protein